MSKGSGGNMAQKATEGELKLRLMAVRRRLTYIEILRLLCLGVFVGLSLSAILMAANKLFGEVFPGWICWIPPALSPLWPLVLAWRGTPDILDAACACDARGDLKERLATWIEVAEGRLVTRDGLVELLREDALEHGSKVAPAEMFPVSLPAWIGLMAIPIMICGAAMLMPDRRTEAVYRWDMGQGIEVTGIAGGEGSSGPPDSPRLGVSPELILRAKLVVSDDLHMRAEEKRDLLQEIEDHLKWKEGLPKELLDELNELAGILRRKIAEESGEFADGDRQAAPGSGESGAAGKTPTSLMVQAPVPKMTVPEVISLYERDFPEYRDLLAKYFSRKAAGREGREDHVDRKGDAGGEDRKGDAGRGDRMGSAAEREESARGEKANERLGVGEKTDGRGPAGSDGKGASPAK